MLNKLIGAALALFSVPALAFPLGVNIGCGTCGSGNVYGGTGYTYGPAADIDNVYAVGVRELRIAVKAPRLVTRPGGSVDPNVNAKLIPLIDHALAKGMTVVLDVHDYGTWFGNVITKSDVPDVVDMWNKAFAKYKGNSRFLPSFMNEPYKAGTSIWDVTQVWISDMRAAGWHGPLIVPGQGYSSLQAFTNYGSKLLGLHDPDSRLIFDGHSYFDSNNSGTHSDVLGLTAADLSNEAGFKQKVHDNFYAKLGKTLAWARKYNQKILVGETALPNTEVAKAATPIIVSLYDENADVIEHLTWWTYTSGMPLPKYMFGLQNTSKQPSEILQRISAAK